MKEKKEFKVVECAGTPYEIGMQYGKACKDSILKSIENHLGGFGMVYNASKAQIIANTQKFLPLVREFDPVLIETLKGQAEGSGTTFEEAFALRCMMELGEYYNQITALCTSFAATGDATVDGKTIIGQNIDWTPAFPMDLLHVKHSDGLEQLTLAFGGVLEWTLSSNGIGIAMNLILSPPAEQKLNIPCGCVIPKAMRQKRIGDALGVFCQAGRGLAYYALASQEGDIIGIEGTPDDFEVLYPENDILVHSNHYLTPRFKKGDWVYALAPDSYLRVYRMKRLMQKNYGKISPELMMSLLSDKNNHPNAICRYIDQDKPPIFHFETVASVIMEPEDRKIRIAYGHPDKYEYISYSL